MEKLIILGTGNANATKCYNTCLALRNERGYFLVDAGGGNGILVQLEKAGIPLTEIHEIFLSHEHTDHILGMVWMIRMIAAQMKQGNYEGNLDIYCHSDLEEPLLTIVGLTVQGKFVKLIGERIFLHPLEDGDEREILGYKIRFFDIRSVKAKQYGFTLTLHSGKRLTFAGDEPCREWEYDYVRNVDWLLHEAFCLYSERERFKPYEKCHTTVKDACELAEALGVKNLILYHTEDKNIARRRELYLAEGEPCFSGKLYVPEDLEVFTLA
ncbi:MAG: MBL fold metallo-hydrolase [Lachnospiraceae bacterium]|jgi:ribonuclease Z|nr:MBL fold metallo-hydrolase [Lachnospiraceae bacterium]